MSLAKSKVRTRIETGQDDHEGHPDPHQLRQLGQRGKAGLGQPNNCRI